MVPEREVGGEAMSVTWPATGLALVAGRPMLVAGKRVSVLPMVTGLVIGPMG